LEIATRIKEWCAIKQIGNVDVKVIMISNAWRKSSIRQFMSELMAPLYTFFNARAARGIYAQNAIRLEQRRFKAGTAAPAPLTKGIIYFRLRDTQVPLPHGWILSAGAAKAVRDQLQLDDDFVQNDTAINEVLKALPPAQ